MADFVSSQRTEAAVFRCFYRTMPRRRAACQRPESAVSQLAWLEERPSLASPITFCRDSATCYSGITTLTIIELRMRATSNRFNLAAEDPVGDIDGNVRIEEVVVRQNDRAESMLRIDHHHALEVNMLAPLPERITLSAVLDARSQAP